MDKAGDILKHIISNKRWEKMFGLEYLKEDWENCVGKAIAAHTSPSFISDKRLFIDVDSPAWATQLNFLQQDIIKKINSFFGKSIVKEIFFQAKPYIKKE